MLVRYTTNFFYKHLFTPPQKKSTEKQFHAEHMRQAVKSFDMQPGWLAGLIGGQDTYSSGI